MSDERPHRRWTVQIKVSADTLEEMRSVLHSVTAVLSSQKKPADKIITSPSSSYFFKLHESPDMTHEKYHAAVAEWQKKRGAPPAGQKPATPGVGVTDCQPPKAETRSTSRAGMLFEGAETSGKPGHAQ